MIAPLLLGMSWMSPDWLLQQFGQALLWVSIVVIFIECGLFFPFLPGDTLLFAIGLFIATGDVSVTGNQGADMVITLTAFATAAFLGNVTGYEIGRRLGPRVSAREGLFLTTRRLDKTRAFFVRHGDRALVIGRFIPFVRTFVTLVAGVAAMDRKRFFVWSGVGAVAWVASITLLGYFLGNTVPGLKDNIDYAIVAILLFSAVPAAVHWLRRRQATEA